MGSFDGTLDSVIAALDAVLEENSRASAKQLREVLVGLEVDIPTVEALAPGPDGAFTIDGTRYVPDSPSRYGDGDLPYGLTLTKDGLNWQGADYVPQSAQPKDVDFGNTALQEAADILDAKPLVSTTNGRIARWLRTL